ncbi:MAG TPA: endonuclease/exonuclease/phosphatase family protein [Acidimicrobiia bacterium]|nr:endonuclease/exonuclease/phosphatase family protein [Acidimicrobiia bacterium]
MNRPLRLATFNVKNGLGTDGVVDNDRLGEVCAELRADVLALQEVDSGAERSGLANQAAVVARACGLSYFFAPAFEMRAGGLYGNALLARGQIDETEVLELPCARERQARVAALARVEIEDVALSVAVTHLQNRRGGAPLVADDAGEQLEQLEGALEALGRRRRPRVLLGDLNSAPAVIEPVLTGAGFSVADTDATAPARAPRLRIDYVAVERLTIVSSEVIATPVSDHRAVVVEATPL